MASPRNKLQYNDIQCTTMLCYAMQATPEAGPWIITLDYPSYGPCMQHLKNRDIREKIYKASLTKASSGETDNSVIINDIMRKKKGVAKILGYNTYAELSLAEKMAPDVDTVLNMIKMLREKSLPAARKEFEELKAYANDKGCSQMDLWDVPYWSERLREERYEFEEEQLRVYFPLDNVLTGMFALIERLFDVRIEAADGEQQVWHPDVKFFKIYESGSPNGSDPIAAFYLDPFSRPGDKRGGAWMNVCVGKSKVLKRVPVAYLTCNGSPPTDGKPSLMTFREVETLFHGIYDMDSHQSSRSLLYCCKM
jgi:oligopeptidase A